VFDAQSFVRKVASTGVCTKEISMQDQVTELARRGNALSPGERSRLVDLLLESLHEPAVAEVEAAWEVEIDHRLAEYERGEINSVDAEEVFSKARSIAR